MKVCPRGPARQEEGARSGRTRITPVTALVPTIIALALLIAATYAVLRIAGVPGRIAPLTAILRGALQLAAISFVLAGVIREGYWVALALAVMFSVAAITAARRLGPRSKRYLTTAAAMAGGVVLAGSIVFTTGAIAATPRYVLAIGGIVIGNAMTTTVLAGRRFLEDAHQQWEQVEGWLALGATPREATRSIARRAVQSALIPSTDQTRTTGLVTLPGAFVGAIFGGLSPFEAGRFQIVVLACIIASGATAAVILVQVLQPLQQQPVPPGAR